MTLTYDLEWVKLNHSANIQVRGHIVRMLSYEHTHTQTHTHTHAHTHTHTSGRNARTIVWCEIFSVFRDIQNYYSNGSFWQGVARVEFCGPQ